jgi:hypothetical protein
MLCGKSGIQYWPALFMLSMQWPSLGEGRRCISGRKARNETKSVAR